MLLLLPRDILTYILSIAVYDAYAEKYYSQSYSVETNILRMRDSFDIAYIVSPMARTMQCLGLIHPTIRSILQKASICKERRTWGIDPHFFHTLCRK